MTEEEKAKKQQEAREKKKAESTFEPGKKPPHHDIDLKDQTPAQLKETCKFHADALADQHAGAHDNPENWDNRNRTTFAVGVIEDKDGNRRLVSTMNDGSPSSKANDHMDEHGITPIDTKPNIGTRRAKEDGKPAFHPDGRKKNETIDMDTAKTDPKTGKPDKSTAEPFDKGERSDHHAEQRMERGGTQPDPTPEEPKRTKPVPGPDEKMVAQSPSQPCCPGCQDALGQPKGDPPTKPIDKIPADRQKKPKP